MSEQGDWIDEYTGRSDAQTFISGRVTTANTAIDAAQIRLSYTTQQVTQAISDLNQVAQEFDADISDFNVTDPKFNADSLKNEIQPEDPRIDFDPLVLSPFTPKPWQGPNVQAPTDPNIDPVDLSALDDLEPPDVDSIVGQAPTDVLKYSPQDYTSGLLDFMVAQIQSEITKTVNLETFQYTPKIDEDGNMLDFDPLKITVLNSYTGGAFGSVQGVQYSPTHISYIDPNVDVKYLPEDVEYMAPLTNTTVDTTLVVAFDDSGYDATDIDISSEITVPLGTPIVGNSVASEVDPEGDTGDIVIVPPEAENAIYARARSRAEAEFNTATTQAENSIQARGFSLPVGTLSANIAKAQVTFSQSMADTNNDIIIFQVQLEQKRTEYELEKSKQVTNAKSLRDSVAIEDAKLKQAATQQQLELVGMISDAESKRDATISARHGLDIENHKLRLEAEVQSVNAQVKNTDVIRSGEDGNLRLDAFELEKAKQDLEAQIKTEENKGRKADIETKLAEFDLRVAEKIFEGKVKTEDNIKAGQEFLLKIDEANYTREEAVQELILKTEEAINARTSSFLEKRDMELKEAETKTSAQAKYDEIMFGVEKINSEWAITSAKNLGVYMDAASKLEALSQQADKQKKDFEFEIEKTNHSALWEEYNSKVQNYKVLMEGYGIEAQTAEITIKTQIDYNNSIIEMYAKEVNIYNTIMGQENIKLEGEKLYADIAWKDIEAEIKKAEAHNKQLEAIAGVYVAETQAYAEKIKGLSIMETLDLQRYDSEVKGKSSQIDAEAKKAIASADMAIKAAAMNIEALKGDVAISSSIISSSLNSMNTQASFGYSGGAKVNRSSTSTKHASIGVNYSGLAEDMGTAPEKLSDL